MTWWMIERDDLSRGPLYFTWILRPDPSHPSQICREGRHGWARGWIEGEHFATKEEAERHTNGDPLLRVREHCLVRKWDDEYCPCGGVWNQRDQCSQCGSLKHVSENGQQVSASCDTHPKGGDVKQAPSPMSGAVDAEGGETPNLPTPSGEHNHG